jgi:release factor glutamine methyltransferase
MSNSVTDMLRGAAAQGLDRLDAQLLLLHALGRAEAGRAWLLAHDTDPLTPQEQDRYRQLCQRRAAGEPLAYIVGHKEFFGLQLAVDPRVLVPRPDTETLVEWALDVLDVLDRKTESDEKALAIDPAGAARTGKPRVVDLGTGSGAIALAIKQHRPDAQVEAVDASAGALEVAGDNARRLGLEVALRQASWLTGTGTRYQLIVSNPPYVAQADPHLAALVHEPLSALAAGADGLEDIRAIAAQAPACLVAGGWLLLEHGWDQAGAVRGLLEAAGFSQVTSRRDLAGIERCSGGCWLELG